MNPLTDEQIQATLVKLGLEAGRTFNGRAMTLGEMASRIEAFTNSVWPWAARERMPDQYTAWKAIYEPAIAAASAAREFTVALVEYRAAVNRLARYRKADGRPEQFETRETGAYDENGDPITEEVSVAPAIDPLPPQIEVEIRDPETGEVTGTEWIDNPAIVADDAERAAKQAVIDGTQMERTIAGETVRLEDYL